MTAQTREKVVVFCTFLSTCVALALLAGSLGSNAWVVATAYKASNVEAHGRVNFGLFRGSRTLNHGFGERVHEMNVMRVQYRERDFFVRELYVATITCVAAGIIAGIAAAALSLHNVASNPVEAICHYPGLIALNMVGFLLSLAAIVTWLVQYFVKLRNNVLVREDIINGKWSTKGQAVVGYSFWLAFLAALVYFVNTAVFMVLQRRRHKSRTVKNQIIEATKPNGNLMLY